MSDTLQHALVAGIIGLVFSIPAAIAIIVINNSSAKKIKRIFKKCEVNKSDGIDYFEYKDKYYNKKLFYDLMRSYYGKKDLDILKKISAEIKERYEISMYKDMELIELCALQKAMEDNEQSIL